MKNKNPIANNKRSLGGLRPVEPSSPKAPTCLGTMRLRRTDVVIFMKQLNESGEAVVESNLAGWMNEDKNGKYLTVEVSPRFKSKKPSFSEVGSVTFPFSADDVDEQPSPSDQVH